MRKVYLAVTVLLVIAVVVQFYFAAFGVFSGDDREAFSGHSVTGTIIIPALSVLAFIVAIIARAGGTTIGLSILPLGLIVVQILLFIIAGATGATPEEPNFAGALILGLHALNGLAILGVSGTLVTRARSLVKHGPPARATESVTEAAGA